MTQSEYISKLITKYELKRDGLLKECALMGMCNEQRNVLSRCGIVEDIIHDLNCALYSDIHK